MNNVLAIITARGGSKRIPGKNIKDFCGKPIIQYSIEAALNSSVFSEVMVSTDSDEIAATARQCGADVPFMRSAKASDDYATTADVLTEVIGEYEKMGRHFEYFACLYPTAPFITAYTLKQAFDKLVSAGGEVLIPVVEFSYPPQRGLVMDSEGTMEYKWPDNFRKRSQDLEKLYHDCGQFYFYRTEAFMREKGQFIKQIIPFVLPESQVQDIDTLQDWELAQVKYELMQRRK